MSKLLSNKMLGLALLVVYATSCVAGMKLMNDEKYINDKMKVESVPLTSIVEAAKSLERKVSEKVDDKSVVVPMLNPDPATSVKVVDNARLIPDVAIKSNVDQSLVNSDTLKPIQPIMPFMVKFPSFLDAILKNNFGLDLSGKVEAGSDAAGSVGAGNADAGDDDIPQPQPQVVEPTQPEKMIQPFNRETIILKNNKRPNGMMSIILMKSSSSNDQQGSEDQAQLQPQQKIAIDPVPMAPGSELDQQQQQQQQQQNIDDASTGMNLAFKTNFMIFRLIPKKLNILFGGDTDPDSKMSNGQHLLGGPSDIDSKFSQLVGQDDLDAMNSKMNGKESAENSGEDAADDDDDDHFKRHHHRKHHHPHDSSLFHFPNFFQFNNDAQNLDAAGSLNMMNNDNNVPSFIIRTDDGSSAFISNDIGQNKPPSSAFSQHYKKKCMMLSFMKLKASAYYRTIIHLLVVSGFILVFMLCALLTIRLCKRKRMLRYYSRQQNANAAMMNIATIDESKKQFVNSSTMGAACAGGKTHQGGCKYRNFFLFKFGNFRTSASGSSLLASPSPYALKQQHHKLIDESDLNTATIRSSSLLIPLPPTYDQAVTTTSDSASSALISDNNNNNNTSSSFTSAVNKIDNSKLEFNSLANAYKSLRNNKKQQQEEKEEEEDTKSLPPYEELKPESK